MSAQPAYPPLPHPVQQASYEIAHNSKNNKKNRSKSTTNWFDWPGCETPPRRRPTPRTHGMLFCNSSPKKESMKNNNPTSPRRAFCGEACGTTTTAVAQKRAASRLACFPRPLSLSLTRNKSRAPKRGKGSQQTLRGIREAHAHHPVCGPTAPAGYDAPVTPLAPIPRDRIEHDSRDQNNTPTRHCEPTGLPFPSDTAAPPSPFVECADWYSADFLSVSWMFCALTGLSTGLQDCYICFYGFGSNK